MYIAYIRDQPEFKKPTRKDKVNALAAHLVNKWRARDAENAEKWWRGLDEEDRMNLINNYENSL